MIDYLLTQNHLTIRYRIAILIECYCAKYLHIGIFINVKNTHRKIKEYEPSYGMTTGEFG